MAELFTKRPVLSGVIAILITLAGAATIPTLPVEWYPNLALPQVVVTSVYTGANAEVVEATVTSTLEAAINGVEGMRYVESTSSNDGVSTITVTFERDRDLDIASVDVQNRVSSVLGRLPAEVRAIGVDVRRASNAIVVAMGFWAENGEYDSIFISNYIDRYVRDELQRIDGVGQVVIFGEREYAMRLWLDPLRLAAHGVSAGDVVAALREQNLQVAAGQIGGAPAPEGQTLQIALAANGHFNTPEDFEGLIVRSADDGRLVRFSDLGRVELGAASYASSLRFNGHDAVGVGVFQLPDANALEVERAVRERMAELSASFPPGLRSERAFNPTEIVGESIDEVLWTLGGTIFLVVLVMFVFLQRWQTTLVPALTIPVSLLGTFAFVKAFGFSINTLTLFGLTLATGLVVDDAIVVVENIERNARERGLGKLAAALAGTNEVFGAVIATTLVLISVFVPTALFPGTTGVLYQQFALTIAFSLALSSVTALTAAPALAALILTPAEETHRGAFGLFNRGFERLRDAFAVTLRASLRRIAIPLAGFAVLAGLGIALYAQIPRGFVPPEDQGYFITMVQGPPGMALAETSRIVGEVTDAMSEDEDVANIFAVQGFSFEGTAPNRATIFTTFRPRHERSGPEHEAPAIVARMQSRLGEISDAIVVAFEPPAIPGIGNVGGFEMQLQDRGNLGLGALAGAAGQLSELSRARPDLMGVFSTFSADDPQLRVVLDRDRCRALGVPISEAFGALQVLVGSAYVNDFTFLERSYRVFVQADAEHRASDAGLRSIYVRSTSGRSVPLAALVRFEDSSAPQIIKHFNLFRAATISGNAAPGRSSGQAIAAMEEIVHRLPQGVGHAWSGLALEESRAGGESTLLFLLGVVLTFLLLAAQYESFTLPVVILSAVPMGILGAVLGTLARGLENDVFAQIGLLMLVGLASKNAILVVEFAQQLRRDEGLTAREAVVKASTTRLRPILMTSFAFVLGMLPLYFASGAGQNARHSLGTTVLWGMVVSTVLNLYVVPAWYLVVVTAAERVRRALGRGAETPAPAPVTR